jgi:hypothetical protein
MVAEKERLEGHIIDNITKEYESPTLLPFSNKKQSQFFVRTSTAERLQCAATKLSTRATLPDSSFHGFARAVRALVLSQVFASRIGLASVVVPGTLYGDPVAKQVLFVYALPGQTRRKFIQFGQVTQI